MKIKHLFPLFLLTLFVPLKCLSQEKEFIVLKTNDTIYGKIIRGNTIFNPTKVIFKIKNKNGKKTVIRPEDVKTIRSLKGVDGDCYITTVYDKFFIKRILDGRIKVYLLVDGTIYYISKDDSEIRSTDIGWFFSREKAHSQIRPLLEDNPEILEEFDALEGSEKNILYIIEKYNNFEAK